MFFYVFLFFSQVQLYVVLLLTLKPQYLIKLHVKQGFMNAELRPINIKPCSKGVCRAGACSCRNVCTDFICQCSSLTRTVEGNSTYNVFRFCSDSVGCRGRQPLQCLCRYCRTRHNLSLPLLLTTCYLLLCLRTESKPLRKIFPAIIHSLAFSVDGASTATE